MPWTTPETFTAGQTLTAASMNLISGNLGYLLAPPSCRAYRNSNTSYTNNTAVTWDTESWDTDSMFSTASNDRITATTAGIYVLTWNGYFSYSGTMTSMNVQWKVNGSDVSYDRRLFSNSGSIAVSCTTTLSLTASQYVQIFIDCGGWSSITHLGSNAYSWITATMIGKTA